MGRYSLDPMFIALSHPYTLSSTDTTVCPYTSRSISLFRNSSHGHVLLSLVNIQLNLSLLPFSLFHTAPGRPEFR